MKSNVSGRFDNSENVSGILSACGGDPVVAFRLRNAADYRLPIKILHISASPTDPPKPTNLPFR
jgi:hypothetical protein